MKKVRPTLFNLETVPYDMKNTLFTILISVVLSTFIVLGITNSEGPLSARRTPQPLTKSGDNLSYTKGSLSVGIASSSADFIVQELIKIVPAGTGTSTCAAGAEGVIMYSTGTNAFYYCNGSGWALFSTP